MEWSTAPQRLCVVAIENGAFKSPSTMVANLTYYKTRLFLILKNEQQNKKINTKQ